MCVFSLFFLLFSFSFFLSFVSVIMITWHSVTFNEIKLIKPTIFTSFTIEAVYAYTPEKIDGFMASSTVHTRARRTLIDFYRKR